MNENCLLTITNRQVMDDDTDEINLTVRGISCTKAGKRYIIYREEDPQTHNEQTTTLKIEHTEGSDTVTLIRHDALHGHNTNLILEKGKRHQCQYGTEFGYVTLGVFTSSLTDTVTDAGGSIRISYTLDVNTNLSIINEITITVKPLDDAGRQPDIDCSEQQNCHDTMTNI